MRCLYEAADRFEAQRLVDFLGEQGIPAVILGDFLSGAAGELPATIFPAVWLVEDRHWFMAQALLREFRQPRTASQAAWRCPVCGETVEGGFEVCWNCGSQRDPD
jgi:hypothetical protein